VADQEENLEQLTEVEMKLRFLLDAADIARNVKPKQALALIKDIDNEIGIWAMTILLARYFEREAQVAAERVPELLSMSDEELLEEMDGRIVPVEELRLPPSGEAL
jgi:hypothetical protein